MVKLFVFGIDGAFPEYIFGEWIDELPNIKKLILEGGFAKMNSTIPPLSVVAWTTICTGKSPSDTGIFECTYRKNFSYDDVHVVSSQNVHEKTIWQIASEQNIKSAICFIPLTWPIKPFNGLLVSGTLTPKALNVKRTYPEELANEIKTELGELPLLDIENFRNFSKEEVINEVYKLSEKHIDVMKYLLDSKKCDLFFGVSNLSDRMNHAFWRYMDKEHRKYKEGDEFEHVLKDYYKFIDAKLGELISHLDEDTKIIVLSDHGITRMHTRVNLADWLIKKKYLVLKEPITSRTELKPEMIDWKKTKAFAIGAYEGQIFLNLVGRESDGIIKSEEYDQIIDQLEKELKEIKGDRGEILNTKIFKKKDYLRGKFENIAPDMIVYFDDLQYGCNNTLIGNETLWSPQTAMGSDDAAHSKQGIFIIKNGKFKNKNLGEINAIDIAPTILNELDINIPTDLLGKVIK